MPYEDLTAHQLAAAYREGALSPVDVAESALARAADVGARVGAFVALSAERTRAQARAAERRLADVRQPADGDRDPYEDPGLLCGVPVPVKDLTRVAGEPFEGGSAVLRGAVAEATDGTARLLEDAGALLVGKTTTPEFGLPSYTEPAGRTPARTPWDLTRTAGGSSGGAAAAVATGVAPLALGSDGGGSIRIPAACCGVVGLKPSRGAISPGPHGAAGIGLVTEGFLCRTVADVAAATAALVGDRPGDWFRSRAGLAADLAAAPRTEPGRRRIGLLTTPLNSDAPVADEALAAVDRAARFLAARGHEVVPIAAPMTPADWDAFRPIWYTGALQAPVPADEEHLLTPFTRWMRDAARQVTGVQYANALTAMQLLVRRLATAWSDLDAVLTPTLADAPWRPEQFRPEDPAEDFEAQTRFTPWTSVWNMTGNAAISVPLHRARRDGVLLPFGVQLGAVRPDQDALLVALAAQLEADDPWPQVVVPGEEPR